jgi:phosphatidylinositol-3-phosphatase
MKLVRAAVLVVVGLVGSVLTVVPSGAAAPATSAMANPPAIRHVFVINLENENYAVTFGAKSPARYLSRTLRAKGALLEQYFAISHKSLGNYLAEISGQGPSLQTQDDCTTYTDFVSSGTSELGQELGDGCVSATSVKTIADQLSASGLTWKGYMEDMTRPCQHPDLGAVDPDVVATAKSTYATRHNPFVYFHSIIDSPSCRTNVVSLDALATDLASATTTPNLSFITPGLCHDGHDDTCPNGRRGGLAAANRWLAHWVPKILASPAFEQDGLLVVTFDEAEGDGDHADASTCCGTPTYPNVTSARAAAPEPGGGRVGAVLVSPFITPDTTTDTPYNHFAVLCSMEDVFSLEHLGYAAQPGLQCFGNDVYTNASGSGASGAGVSG